MAVAPHIFTPSNAHKALLSARKFLLSNLGIRTLDQSDWNYNGDYDNSNDSADRKVAHGFNYHNGPVRNSCLRLNIDLEIFNAKY